MYPLKYSLNAFATLLGVSNNPSLEGSSPIHCKIFINASSASLSEILSVFLWFSFLTNFQSLFQDVFLLVFVLLIHYFYVV